MAESITCPTCGKPMSSNGAESFCPACIMRFGLESGSAPTNNPKERAFTPPSPDELSAFFPGLDIIALLGRGGMGAVYKVRQKNLNRFAALKILPPDVADAPSFAKRFEREAQALAKLNHPNIVTLYEFGKADGLYFFLMEFVDGVNLRQLLSSGKIESKEALAIVPQICDALQFAHDHGIVHRDIKPENLLLDKQGRIKIADFGIAKILDVTDTASTTDSVSAEQPEISAAAGTPQYMAPEQKAQQSTDHRADIYSLGVVFYELLTGELPGATLQPPSKKVQIDVRLDEIVLRALEAKPEHRYQTAAAFRRQVETVSSNPSSLPSELSTAVASPRFSRTAIVGACLVAMGFLSFFMSLFMDRIAPQTTIADANRTVTPAAYALFGAGLIYMFVATLLGWISVTQIQRSEGKIYGLGLAVFDGLLFPLLALDALILAVDLSGRYYVTGPGITPGVTMAQMDIPGWQMLLVLLFILLVDYLIIRSVWRAVNRSLASNPPAAFPDAPRPMNRTAIAVSFVILVLCIFGLQTLISYVKAGDPTRAITSATVPNQSFGPVIERVLPFDRSFIDFQSGSVMRPDLEKFGVSGADWEPWIQQTGADAMVEESPQPGFVPPAPNAHGFPRLVALRSDHPERRGDRESCVFVGEETDDFDSVRPNDVDARLKVVTERDLYWGLANSPRPWWFKTRDGAKGVLQILGTSDNPRGLKIRYKLVVSGPVGGPSAAPSIPLHIEFKALRVENPPGTRNILLYFERDTNPGLGIEVTQDMTTLSGGNAPKEGYRTSQQKTWVGLKDGRVLGWTLPAEFTEDEARAVAKDMEKRAKTFRQLPDGAVPAFANVHHRDGWTYTLFARVVREPGTPHPPGEQVAQSNTAQSLKMILEHERQLAEKAISKPAADVTKPATPADSLAAIELQIARRQLEKAMADLQDAQTEAALGPNKPGMSADEQKAADARVRKKVTILQERVMELREQLNRSVPKKNEPIQPEKPVNPELF